MLSDIVSLCCLRKRKQTKQCFGCYIQTNKYCPIRGGMLWVHTLTQTLLNLVCTIYFRKTEPTRQFLQLDCFHGRKVACTVLWSDLYISGDICGENSDNFIFVQYHFLFFMVIRTDYNYTIAEILHFWVLTFWQAHPAKKAYCMNQYLRCFF